MLFAYDSSCLVPFLNQWHPQHAATRADFKRRRQAHDNFVVMPHSLLETFAVLTRVPIPQRTAPADAVLALEALVRMAQPGPSLTPETALRAMRNVTGVGRQGGAIYDAHLFLMAELAGVEEFVTWNTKDFVAYSKPSIRVISPAGEHTPART